MTEKGHDGAAVNDTADGNRLTVVCFRQLFHLIKTLHAPFYKLLPAFPAGKRQCAVAVDPRLILCITGQFLIIFVFKCTEVAFLQILYILYLRRICKLRPQDLCSLSATEMFCALILKNRILG